MAKLVEILARELKEWPQGLECLSQLKGTGYIINGKGFDGRAFDALEMAEETHIAGAIVTRAEWQAAVDALKAKDIASSTAAMIDAGWIDPNPPVSPSLHAQVVGRANRTPEWDGVGLPPVGVKALHIDAGNLRIIAHIDQGHDGQDIAAVGQKGDKGQLFIATAEYWRTAISPMQAAIQERYIQEIEDAISYVVGRDNRRSAAEALYKAGYRKQEPK